MTESRVIGLLHPGEMGAVVGRCLTGRGFQVLWASAGRGPRTAERAHEAGLTDVGTAQAISGQAEVIFSICPPHAARDVARSVRGFRGQFVDANATAPHTSREVGQIIESGGGSYVDGGIIGPPPSVPGSTRLYLSGDAAAQVRDLFSGSPLDAKVVPGDACAASAVKMAYAAWTKGSAALLLAARALAAAQGVSDVLLSEWGLSQPELDCRVGGAAQSAVSKGWRWVGEMEEIAATMASAGLPDVFHLAAAEIFSRAPRAEPGADPADAASQVLTALSVGLGRPDN